jgi:hypothetical protein
MLRNLAISTFLCACVISIARADVFRWVDDHGSVHYSDQWVPGSEVIKSSPKPRNGGSDTSSQTPYSAPKSNGTTPSGDTAAKAVKQDMAKVRDQQCKEAKERYEKAIQARRIYKPGPASDKSKDVDRPDDRQYLSEEAADAYRVKARQDVQDFCGASAPKPSGE